MPHVEIHRQALLKNFKALYRNPHQASAEHIEQVYTQDVEFRDPTRQGVGLLALKNHLRHLHGGALYTQFDFLDEQCSDNTAVITWQMQYTPRRGFRRRAVTLRGMTQLRFTDRIYYQEDFYDLGLSLYQHVPVLGSFLRFVHRRWLAG